MALSKRATLLRDDMVPKRRRLLSQVQLVKIGRQRRTNRRKYPGVTATMSFTAPAEIDAILDRWASKWDVSRSTVFRQAVLLANDKWESEED